MKKVSVSIIGTEILKLNKTLKVLEDANVDFIHLDVMDGVFVNNLTFGPDIAHEIINSTHIPADTHLMIKYPEKYIDRFIDIGSEFITVHVESEGNKHKIIDRIKERGKKAGITLNPDTPLSKIDPYLPMVDLVLVMTVHPGFYGQKFREDCIQKLREIKEIREKRGFGFFIEVDGGINKETAPKVAPYVDIIVSASFVFKGKDIKERILFLKQL